MKNIFNFLEKVKFSLFFEKSESIAKKFLRNFLSFSRIIIDDSQSLLVKNDVFYLELGGGNDNNNSKLFGKKSYPGVLLNDNYFLVRKIEIPYISSEDIKRAVLLEAKMATPFEDSQSLVTYDFDYQSINDAKHKVNIYITSKELVEKNIVNKKIILKNEDFPEVWLEVSKDKKVLLPGFGEFKRKNDENKRTIFVILVMAISIFSLAILFMMPTLNLRNEAISANKDTQLLIKKTEDVMHARHLLSSELSLMDELSQRKNFTHHMSTIAFLTENIPEDTAIQSIIFNGNNLQIMGLSGNASALIPLLSKSSIFSKVEMMNAITRVSNTNKEIFNLKIEINSSFFDSKE